MEYKAALIILYDSAKRILLQRRSKDAQVLSDYWAFFGGGIKPRETTVQAVYREALEELNYNLKSPKLFIEQDFQIDNFKGHMYVYIEYFEWDKSYLKLQEGEDWGWFSAKEIENLKMIEHDKRLVHSLFNYLETEQMQLLF